MLMQGDPGPQGVPGYEGRPGDRVSVPTFEITNKSSIL